MSSNFLQEEVNGRPWKEATPPERVLVIRLQAMGDCAISLPAIQALRNQLPAGTRIDLLTRQETGPVNAAFHLYDQVYQLPGGRNGKRIYMWAVLYLFRLWFTQYDVVIDLQRNRQSRVVRSLLVPKAWSEIERFSPTLAVEKYQVGIKKAGFLIPELDHKLKLKQPQAGDGVLSSAGWSSSHQLIVLNPAGFHATRNWPLDRYLDFARDWLEDYPETQFAMMGYAGMKDKAAYLKNSLGPAFLDLTGKTTVIEALAILAKASILISEDSGLMHMAWVQGVPTLAIFGSSRYDWSRPVGPHTDTLCALDLPCIGCLSDECKHGDNRCLTRFSVEDVKAAALALQKEPIL